MQTSDCMGPGWGRYPLPSCPYPPRTALDRRRAQWIGRDSSTFARIRT